MAVIKGKDGKLNYINEYKFYKYEGPFFDDIWEYQEIKEKFFTVQKMDKPKKDKPKEYITDRDLEIDI